MNGAATPTRILIVDDDDLLRSMLAQVLTRAGYLVDTAADGNAGIKAFEREPADLVITDLIMPEKEGLETIVQLRRISPALKLIAMSGGGKYSASDYLPLAKKLGAARTLSKPFSRQELLSLVAEALAEG